MPLTCSDSRTHRVGLVPGRGDAWAGGTLPPPDLGSEIPSKAARVSSARPAFPGPSAARVRSGAPSPAASAAGAPCRPPAPTPSLPLGYWQVLLREHSALCSRTPVPPPDEVGSPVSCPPGPSRPGGGSSARSGDGPSRRRKKHPPRRPQTPAGPEPSPDQARAPAAGVGAPFPPEAGKPKQALQEPHSSGGARGVGRAPRPSPAAPPTAPPDRPLPQRLRCACACCRRSTAAVPPLPPSLGLPLAAPAHRPSRDGGTNLATRALRRL
ncbi:translation initiation factor IF-2-like [Neovison vison]|uniref:translation initiation factor IF-2-like n=1 Tax=Neovison vison TaxID=452646 RepID=UPI001CF081BE|nr:translation initiation factor IF-2-like [Neogale vison]